MVDDESYGIMPYSEISDLKKQIKSLSQNAQGNSGELLNSMNSLTKGMDSMLQLFKQAAEEMKLEEQEEKALSVEIKPLMDKVDEIIEQNKIIAEGMVALSDIVKEKLADIEDKLKSMPVQQVSQQMIPPPQMQQMQMPQMQQQTSQSYQPTSFLDEPHQIPQPRPVVFPADAKMNQMGQMMPPPNFGPQGPEQQDFFPPNFGPQNQVPQQKDAKKGFFGMK